MKFLQFIANDYLFLIINALIFIALIVITRWLTLRQMQPQQDAASITSPRQWAEAVTLLHKHQQQIHLLLAAFYKSLQTKDWAAAHQQRAAMSHFLMMAYLPALESAGHQVLPHERTRWRDELLTTSLRTASAIMEVCNADNVLQLLDEHPIHWDATSFQTIRQWAAAHQLTTELAALDKSLARK